MFKKFYSGMSSKFVNSIDNEGLNNSNKRHYC